MIDTDRDMVSNAIRTLDETMMMLTGIETLHAKALIKIIHGVLIILEIENGNHV